MSDKKRSNYNSHRRPPAEEREERYVNTYVAYLYHPMPPADVQALQHFEAENIDNVENLIEHLVLNGYKVSFYLTKEGEGVMAEICDLDSHRESHGWRLTAGSRKTIGAFMCLCYKHYKSMAEDWTAMMNAKKRDRPDIW